MIQDRPGPVEAFLPGIVWRASQCGWLKIGKTAQGHDLWEKPDGRRMVIRAGVEPLVPVRLTPAPPRPVMGDVLTGWLFRKVNAGHSD
jgi:hypothetical protein